MKYKSYAILLVTCFSLFFAYFAGITEPTDDTTYNHNKPAIYLNNRYLNGDSLVVEASVYNNCSEDVCKPSSGLCDCDEDCHSFPLSEDLRLSMKVYKNDVLVVSKEEVKTASESSIVSVQFNFHVILPDTTGEYVIQLVATELTKNKNSDQYTNFIVAGEGINGTFNLSEYRVRCNDNSVTYFYHEGNRLSGSIVINGTSFSLDMNYTPRDEQPCDGSAYNFSESGNISIDYENKAITISYEDGNTTVSQDFNFTFNGSELKLSLEKDGSLRELFFQKQ